MDGAPLAGRRSAGGSLYELIETGELQKQAEGTATLILRLRIKYGLFLEHERCYN